MPDRAFARHRLIQTLLHRCGVEPYTQVVMRDLKGKRRITFYTRSKRLVGKVKASFEAYLAEHSVQGIPDFLQVRCLNREDWVDKWKEDYHIMPVGHRFSLIPAWEYNLYRPGKRLPILLDPESAFGRGTHETTSLMLRMIEGYEGKFESFMDAGCGTGILSIAAYRLGAREIVGLDKETRVAKIATRNLKRNGCDFAKCYNKRLVQYGVKQKYDLVAANILSRILLSNRRQLHAIVKPGGHLLVSGIYRENLEEFKKCFGGPRLRCLKVWRGRKWSGIVYKKIGK